MAPRSPHGAIQERTLEFGKRALKLHTALCACRNEAARLMGKQFVRAATSIGANIQEGCGAESRADFIHKYAIAEKEARESHYWLELIMDAEFVPSTRISSLRNEASEIIAIINASIKTAKRNSSNP